MQNHRHHDDHQGYWKWMPAALALAGVIVFIFATFGPPASSSGFVSTLKGLWAAVAPDYVQSKAHYGMIPGPGSPARYSAARAGAQQTPSSTTSPTAGSQISSSG